MRDVVQADGAGSLQHRRAVITVRLWGGLTYGEDVLEDSGCYEYQQFRSVVLGAGVFEQNAQVRDISQQRDLIYGGLLVFNVNSTYHYGTAVFHQRLSVDGLGVNGRAVDGILPD